MKQANSIVFMEFVKFLKDRFNKHTEIIDDNEVLKIVNKSKSEVFNCKDEETAEACYGYFQFLKMVYGSDIEFVLSNLDSFTEIAVIVKKNGYCKTGIDLKDDLIVREISVSEFFNGPNQ